MRNTCLEIHFNPVYVYVKNMFGLAFENDGRVLLSTGVVTTTLQLIQDFLHVNYFGVTNLSFLIVMSTILVDAYYGVKKSVKESKEALIKHDKIEGNTAEKRALYKRHELKKFNPAKLQYTFFKALTLVVYLFFVKSLLEYNVDGDIFVEVIGFSSVVVMKAPIIIFWYYDFKSIGNNTAYIYGKKAPIFEIVENIFGFRISKFFKNNED